VNVKRILHITDSMDKGGIEAFIMNVYRNINREEIQFDFLVSTNSKCFYEDEIIQLGGNVYRTVPKSTGLLNFIKTTNKNLNKLPIYDVVHIHVSSLISALGWLLTDVKKIPRKMFHSHNTHSKQDITGIVRGIGQFILKKNSTFMLACSVAAGKWLYGDTAYNNGKIIIIKNGIDVESFFYDRSLGNKLRDSLNINDKFVLGHIGRFNEQKNHDFIVDIYNNIYLKDNNSVLLLVGKGNLESDIKKKVKLLNLESNVLFLGLRDDINSLLNGMDVFLLPSLHEGLPVVGIEAQATGIKMFMSEEITKEVDITGLINFIDLNKSADFWAEEILKCKSFKRRPTKDLIIKNGFDIKDVAKNLTKLYTD
jgi:glycosyltransferase involved in cell wall biosynthesis